MRNIITVIPQLVNFARFKRKTSRNNAIFSNCLFCVQKNLSTKLLKAGKTGLVCRGGAAPYDVPLWLGGVAGLDHGVQPEEIPQHGSHKGKEPYELVPPAVEP